MGLLLLLVPALFTFIGKYLPFVVVAVVVVVVAVVVVL